MGANVAAARNYKKGRVMRAVYREQTYIHGECATVSLYPVFETRRARRGRYLPTSEAQQALNEWNRKERLGRQLDANFRRGEGFWMLTFDDAALPQTRGECIRLYQAFKKRVARYMERAGLGTLRMATVIHGDAGRQDEGGRLHLHAVIGADIPAEVMDVLWGHGYVQVRPLRPGKLGLRGLAAYMLKGMWWGRVMTTRNLIDPLPRERTGRIGKDAVKEIHDNWNDKKAYEGLLPGYEVVDVRPMFNYFNRYYYLRVYLHRSSEL